MERARTLTLKVPYPPSVNRMYRVFRNRSILSKAGRDYKRDIQVAVGIVKRFDGRVRISAWLHPPDKRRRDCDNALKGLLDGLTTSGVWLDDSQLDEIHVYRAACSKPGYVTVRIREL
jgi:crossover junction endodeoxyribonuclease RusA